MQKCNCQNSDRLKLFIETGYYKLIGNKFFIKDVLFEVKSTSTIKDGSKFLRVHLSPNQFYDINLISVNHSYIGIINNSIDESEDTFVINLFFLASEVSIETYRLDYVNSFSTSYLFGVKDYV